MYQIIAVEFSQEENVGVPCLGVRYQDREELALAPFNGYGLVRTILPGSLAFQHQSPTGGLQLQEIATPTYWLHYIECRFAPRHRMEFRFPPGTFCFIFCLGDPVWWARPEKEDQLKTGQFVLLPPETQMGSMETTNGSSRLFVLSCSPSLMAPLFPYYTFLGPKEDRTAAVFTKRWWIPPDIWEILEQIFKSRFDAYLRQFFLDNKVRDLVFFALAQTGMPALYEDKLSFGDLEKIYAARGLIFSDLSQHHNLVDLARKVGLNEFKLKLGFRKLFGSGPFTFLKNERMKKARNLLLQTDKPLKEIAALAGYESLSSFASAYRQYFKETTRQTRKNRGIGP